MDNFTRELVQFIIGEREALNAANARIAKLEARVAELKASRNRHAYNAYEARRKRNRNAQGLTFWKARAEEMEEALKPFAQLGESLLKCGPNDSSPFVHTPDDHTVLKANIFGWDITASQLRAAALASKP